MIERWSPPRTFSRGDKAELREMADRVVTAMATQELDNLDAGEPQACYSSLLQGL